MTQKVERLSSYGVRLWAVLEAEILKKNAFLLPLRLFIALGWLRAGVEKHPAHSRDALSIRIARRGAAAQSEIRFRCQRANCCASRADC